MFEPTCLRRIPGCPHSEIETSCLKQVPCQKLSPCFKGCGYLKSANSCVRADVHMDIYRHTCVKLTYIQTRLSGDHLSIDILTFQNIFFQTHDKTRAK